MNSEYSERSIGQLVAERPSRSRVFERWGIDYCCGGKKRLEQTCKSLAIDLEAVQQDLEDESIFETDDRTDWNSVPLPALVSNIVNTHHAYLREALPRLSALTQKVRDAHGKRHPELAPLAEVFSSFREHMEEHAGKEERFLFPYIEALASNEAQPALECGSIANAIQVMEREHEDAGDALDAMRRLTSGYRVPEGACATYRAMLDALAQLEADTHTHVHKENHILFPRAVALEGELLHGSEDRD